MLTLDMRYNEPVTSALAF